jgi:hypothetical protein
MALRILFNPTSNAHQNPNALISQSKSPRELPPKPKKFEPPRRPDAEKKTQTKNSPRLCGKKTCFAENKSICPNPTPQNKPATLTFFQIP